MPRSVALAAAGLVLAGATAGVAYAVADNVKAPYTQAAATVKENGTIHNAKGIKEVRRLRAGEYCVTFSDTSLKVSKSITQATAHNVNRIVQVTWGQESCGTGGNIAKVNTTNQAGTKADSWFTIAIL
jgi:hypothetical protein